MRYGGCSVYDASVVRVLCWRDRGCSSLAGTSGSVLICGYGGCSVWPRKCIRVYCRMDQTWDSVVRSA